MFSIIIPTWNNLDYLRLCIESIEKNSIYQHQIVVHVNDGSDGTLDWVKSRGVLHTHSEANVGVCMAVNQACLKAENDFIVYMNDDMYVCPEWDRYLTDEINRLKTDCFMFSSTMIEPVDTANNCVIVKNYGTSIDTFKETELLKEYQTLDKNDWNGSTWPPTIVSRKYWLITGGYSIEFSPGMSSDDDFAMKMWMAGCRIFKGVAKSRVYHFQTKSTARVNKNNGRRQFLLKWGINQSTFRKHYLKRGESYCGLLPEPDKRKLKWELIRAWIKRKLV
jgi:glycosyltransferase involved in cell wall biosynthesis